jgi:hypothetical protein
MFPHDKDGVATIARGLPITYINFPNYKNGANRHDLKKIEALSASGVKTADICHQLRILEAVVKRAMPKRTRRTKAEMKEAS